MNLLLQELPKGIQLIISRKLSELQWEDWELPKLLLVEIKARDKCGAGKAVAKRSDINGHVTAAAPTTSRTGKNNCTFCRKKS